MDEIRWNQLFAAVGIKMVVPQPVEFIWFIGGPDRDRTDDLFHAIDPKLGFSTTYKTPVAP
jgi:hypothetical protein